MSQWQTSQSPLADISSSLGKILKLSGSRDSMSENSGEQFLFHGTPMDDLFKQCQSEQWKSRPKHVETEEEELERLKDDNQRLVTALRSLKPLIHGALQEQYSLECRIRMLEQYSQSLERENRRLNEKLDYFHNNQRYINGFVSDTYGNSAERQENGVDDSEQFDEQDYEYEENDNLEELPDEIDETEDQEDGDIGGESDSFDNIRQYEDLDPSPVLNL